MNIGMILNTRFPPDIRVEKEARALISAGYRVYLLTGPQEGRSDQEEVEGIIVQRVSPVASLGTLRQKINSLRFYLTLRNELWRREIAKFIDTFKIDVLHVHDLPMVGTGILAAREKGIPIVADLHENYPAGLQVWRGSSRNFKQNIIHKLFNSLNRWVEYEKRCVHEVERVIVVVDEAKERILKYGIPDDKVTVLMNVEDIEVFSGIEMGPEILSRYRREGTFIVSYVGGFGPHRGLDIAIKSVALLRDRIQNVKLLLVGAQTGEYPLILKSLIRESHAGDLVEITGWQPFERVPSFLQASDVCLVPHHKNPHTDSTIPHKLFQYMLMGKPVVVSDCRPLKRIVEGTDSGLVFRAGDAQDLADKLLILYRDPALRDKYGAHGREAVLSRYNWAKESSKLIKLYPRN